VASAQLVAQLVGHRRTPWTVRGWGRAPQLPGSWLAGLCQRATTRQGRCRRVGRHHGRIPHTRERCISGWHACLAGWRFVWVQVAWHPHNPDVLATGSLDHAVIVWSVGAAQRLAHLNTGYPIAALCFTACGDMLAVQAGRKVCAAVPARLLTCLHGHAASSKPYNHTCRVAPLYWLACGHLPHCSHRVPADADVALAAAAAGRRPATSGAEDQPRPTRGVGAAHGQAAGGGSGRAGQAGGRARRALPLGDLVPRWQAACAPEAPVPPKHLCPRSWAPAGGLLLPPPMPCRPKQLPASSRQRSPPSLETCGC
jgi:hypothetical protein